MIHDEEGSFAQAMRVKSQILVKTERAWTFGKLGLDLIGIVLIAVSVSYCTQ